MQHSKSALPSLFHVLVTGVGPGESGGDPLPSEFNTHILPALAGLPEGNYVVYDSEESAYTVVPTDDQLASWAYGSVITEWSGSAGYGDITAVQDGGLVISYAGSAGNSAISVWVIPAE